MNLSSLVNYFWSPRKVNEEVLRRAFKSSNDVSPNYIVWLGPRGYTLEITCVCGLAFPIFPDSDGRLEWFHDVPMCGWSQTLFLESYNEWLETKAQRKKRLKGAEDN